MVAGHRCIHRLGACHLGVAAFPSQSLLRVSTFSPVSSPAHLVQSSATPNHAMLRTAPGVTAHAAAACASEPFRTQLCSEFSHRKSQRYSMLRTNSVFCICLLLSLLICGCLKRSTNVKEPEANGKRSTATLLATIKPGMQKQTVVALLGEPAVERELGDGAERVDFLFHNERRVDDIGGVVIFFQGDLVSRTEPIYVLSSEKTRK